jgi:hypothetical protein
MLPNPESSTQSSNHQATCAARKADGTPCRARPLPGRHCCLFHDPSHAEAMRSGRRCGGAAPRRRYSRLPRHFTADQVTRHLARLFVDALNAPAALDPALLRTLTRAAALLLQAAPVPSPGAEQATNRPATGHPATNHSLPELQPRPSPAAPPPAPPNLQAPSISCARQALDRSGTGHPGTNALLSSPAAPPACLALLANSGVRAVFPCIDAESGIRRAVDAKTHQPSRGDRCGALARAAAPHASPLMCRRGMRCIVMRSGCHRKACSRGSCVGALDQNLEGLK